jgi:hypothetical protein
MDMSLTQNLTFIENWQFVPEASPPGSIFFTMMVKYDEMNGFRYQMKHHFSAENATQFGSRYGTFTRFGILTFAQQYRHHYPLKLHLI